MYASAIVYSVVTMIVYVGQSTAALAVVLLFPVGRSCNLQYQQENSKVVYQAAV